MIRTREGYIVLSHEHATLTHPPVCEVVAPPLERDAAIDAVVALVCRRRLRFTSDTVEDIFAKDTVTRTLYLRTLLRRTLLHGYCC